MAHSAWKTRLVDDLDGSEAAETVTFQVDFRGYEIDLNEEHAARLRDNVHSVRNSCPSGRW